MPGLQLVANLGVNGYTSHDLIDKELPALAGLRADFVTLMIGVNDVVLVLLAADRILCVATPEFPVTPLWVDAIQPVVEELLLPSNDR